MATTDVRVGPLGPIPGERQLRRDVGLVGLMFTSLGSIIGSGWLFGSLYAAQQAGPSPLISWVIGGAALIRLAPRASCRRSPPVGSSLRCSASSRPSSSLVRAATRTATSPRR